MFSSRDNPLPFHGSFIEIQLGTFSERELLRHGFRAQDKMLKIANLDRDVEVENSGLSSWSDCVCDTKAVQETADEMDGKIPPKMRSQSRGVASRTERYRRSAWLRYPVGKGEHPVGKSSYQRNILRESSRK